MSYENLSLNILRNIGGIENVVSLTHCATRLRFVVKNEDIVDDNELKAESDVMGVVKKGGQVQVVIGTHVNHVCDALLNLIDGRAASVVNDSSSTHSESSEVAGDKSNKKAMLDTLFGFISGSFSPLLPVIAGTGMLKAILAILDNMALLDASSPTYIYLNSLSNGVVYFMPLFLGITSAIKIGTNPYIAAAIGAALLEPGFVSLSKSATEVAGSLDIFGLHLSPLEYSASVFPILFAVVMQKYVEQFVDKISPKSLSLFLVPLATLIVVTTATLVVFGPIGTFLSSSIADFIKYLSINSGLLAGLVLGAGITYMVLLGLHWGLIPIIMSNIITTGADMTVGMTVCAIYAQIGLAVACYFKSKNTKTKTLSLSASMTGLFAGVTEPILYGLVLRNKKYVGIVAVAGGIGGAINGLNHVQINGFAMQGIFSFSLFSPFTPFLIGIGLSFVIAFLTTIFVYKDN